MTPCRTMPYIPRHSCFHTDVRPISIRFWRCPQTHARTHSHSHAYTGSKRMQSLERKAKGVTAAINVCSDSPGLSAFLSFSRFPSLSLSNGPSTWFLSFSPSPSIHSHVCVWVWVWLRVSFYTLLHIRLYAAHTITCQTHLSIYKS